MSDAPSAAAGERLDRFLARHLGSRAAAARRSSAARSSTAAVRPRSHRLEGGERGRAPGRPEAPRALQRRSARRPRSSGRTSTSPSSTSPPGSSSTRAPDARREPSSTLLAGFVAGGEPERPGIVHRLDRDTSGLLVVARSEEAHRRLSALVRRRALERTLPRARRVAAPRSRAGRIEAPIGRDRDDPTRFRSTPTRRARRSRTSRSSSPAAEHALLRVRLETGRTHQIRVHLAAIDLPVVGDAVYGVREPALGRQFLHAARLAFPHPFTGELVEAELAAAAGARRRTSTALG